MIVGQKGQPLELVFAGAVHRNVVAQYPARAFGILLPELEIDSVAEREAVLDPRSHRVVVLIESLLGIVERNAVAQQVRAFGVGPAFAAADVQTPAAHLEAVAVAGPDLFGQASARAVGVHVNVVFTMPRVPCPAVGHLHGVTAFVEVPRIVGVVPGAAADETVAPAAALFDGESVGIGSGGWDTPVDGPPVEIVVRIAVDEGVPGGFLPVGVRKRFARFLVAETHREARTAVVVRHAAVESVVRAVDDPESFVVGSGDLDALQIPVAAFAQDDALPRPDRFGQPRAFEHGLFPVVGQHADRFRLGASGIELQSFDERVFSAAQVDGPPFRSLLHSLMDRAGTFDRAVAGGLGVGGCEDDFARGRRRISVAALGRGSAGAGEK